MSKASDAPREYGVTPFLSVAASYACAHSSLVNQDAKVLLTNGTCTCFHVNHRQSRLVQVCRLCLWVLPAVQRSSRHQRAASNTARLHNVSFTWHNFNSLTQSPHTFSD